MPDVHTSSKISPINKSPLSSSELHDLRFDWTKYLLGDSKHVVVNGVHFTKFYPTPESTLCFSYKNASGLIHPDNGYIRNGEYYFMVDIHPSYSNEAQYGGTCMPNLKEMAKEIKESWKSFTK